MNKRVCLSACANKHRDLPACFLSIFQRWRSSGHMRILQQALCLSCLPRYHSRLDFRRIFFLPLKLNVMFFPTSKVIVPKSFPVRIVRALFGTFLVIIRIPLCLVILVWLVFCKTLASLLPIPLVRRALTRHIDFMGCRMLLALLGYVNKLEILVSFCFPCMPAQSHTHTHVCADSGGFLRAGRRRTQSQPGVRASSHGLLVAMRHPERC